MFVTSILLVLFFATVCNIRIKEVHDSSRYCIKTRKTCNTNLDVRSKVLIPELSRTLCRFFRAEQCIPAVQKFFRRYCKRIRCSKTKVLELCHFLICCISCSVIIQITYFGIRFSHLLPSFPNNRLKLNFCSIQDPCEEFKHFAVRVRG